MDGQTDIYDRRMYGHTDSQHETIVSHHYCVAGYKKEKYI